ncbi:MAG: tRNA (uridine(54)-C5)-methyltransferase TrmA [Halioglobus sp.]
MARTCELLAPFEPPEPEIFTSPATGFRMRAEFRVWHDGDGLDYVMFRPDDPKTPVVIDNFPIADESIQTLMPLLLKQIRPNAVLRRKLFQIEFLSTLSGEMLVSLIYHRKLDEEWERATNALRQTLQADFPCLSIIGRSRRQKIVQGNDYVTECLTVNGLEYRYVQYEQAFTQPNACVNTRMLEWACARAIEWPRADLLELFCGNGNFTLPLSRYFEQVVATELAKVSVRAARANLEMNAINNVTMVRLSAQEVTQAINGEREFRRLAELKQPLAQFDLRTLFVDPPRAGLDAHTLGMASQFDYVLYISCNPRTLSDNLSVLGDSHRITHFALFDQFPYTDHMECGVALARKRAS